MSSKPSGALFVRDDLIFGMAEVDVWLFVGCFEVLLMCETKEWKGFKLRRSVKNTSLS